MQPDSGAVALVAGASGLVGTELARVLAASGDYRRVIALSRRPLAFESPRLANRILRFENLEQDLRGTTCDDAYCCLGSTIRQAGTQAAFRAVDHDLILRFARFAQAAGAKTLVVVSAAGAAADSRNFYLRVKGETELALEALRFRSLHLMQPSLILGSRKQWRITEVVGGVVMPLVNPLLLGRFEQWRAIPARTIALAMRAAARSGRLGVHRHAWRSMRLMAQPVASKPRV
ncbi:MAG TPA: NAD-dependent epimerase/dehydratase family protein [Steroidobacteraceae bacterium]|nr:NAD-dependent epimerase/dehydratase family protein [Steroidobacteraceae bacterium]